MKKALLFLLVCTSFQVLALSLRDLGKVDYDKANSQSQVDLENRIYNQIMNERVTSTLTAGQVRFEDSHVYTTGMGENLGESGRDVKGNLN